MKLKAFIFFETINSIYKPLERLIGEEKDKFPISTIKNGTCPHSPPVLQGPRMKWTSSLKEGTKLTHTLSSLSSIKEIERVPETFQQRKAWAHTSALRILKCSGKD